MVLTSLNDTSIITIWYSIDGGDKWQEPLLDTKVFEIDTNNLYSLSLETSPTTVSNKRNKRKEKK
jgi:hypothetical protein